MYPMPHLSKMVAIPYQNYNKTDINVQLLKKKQQKTKYTVSTYIYDINKLNVITGVHCLQVRKLCLFYNPWCLQSGWNLSHFVQGVNHIRFLHEINNAGVKKIKRCHRVWWILLYHLVKVVVGLRCLKLLNFPPFVPQMCVFFIIINRKKHR